MEPLFFLKKEKVFILISTKFPLKKKKKISSRKLPGRKCWTFRQNLSDSFCVSSLIC